MLSQMRGAWMERDSWLACALLGGFSRSVSWAEEDIEDNEGGADGDGGVGDVESGIVVGAEPDFEEIGNGAVEDAIGDVASGAAEKKRKAGGGEAASAMTSDEKPGEDSDDHERAGDEDDASPGRSRIREEAKGDAGIAGANEINEVVNDFVAPAFGGLRFEPGFGGAVEENDGEGEPEEAEARRKIHEVNEVKEAEEADILGDRHTCRPVAFDFGEGFGATLADGWIARVFADMLGVIPAALAFRAFGVLDFQREFRE